MKKIILLFFALALSVSGAFAENEAATKLVRSHYNFKDFTMLSVSNTFNVELTFADAYSVDVEVPDFLEPYLKISCTAGKLRIGLVNLPKDIQKKLNDKHDLLRAWVSMPELRELSMSGATRLSAFGVPKLEAGESLSIEMSGASRIEQFEAQGKGRLGVDMSGASRANLKAGFRVLDIDLSGACRVNLDGSADKVKYDGSGASSCQLTGDYGDLDCDVSGSSKLNVDGNVRSFEADASGASKFEVEGTTDRAYVELSGASKGRITVTEKLVYELSGASTLRINDKGADKQGQSSRGSKIEFIR